MNKERSLPTEMVVEPNVLNNKKYQELMRDTEWVDVNFGRYVLLADGELVGVFEDRLDAYSQIQFQVCEEVLVKQVGE